MKICTLSKRSKYDKALKTVGRRNERKTKTRYFGKFGLITLCRNFLLARASKSLATDDRCSGTICTEENLEVAFERFINTVQTSAENAAKKSSAAVLDATGRASEFVQTAVQKIFQWKGCHIDKLPLWMRDNDYIIFGHRPQLSSFGECFRSIFRIHTETGNIWTHLIGFVAFTVAMIVFYIKPFCETCIQDIHFCDKLIFLFFFIAALLCLACSTLFHTVACHSPNVCSLFGRLDYCGIAVLTIGSVIPWLYYGFYCQFYTKLTYMTIEGSFGAATIALIMWEKFGRPEYRIFRALVFISLGIISSLPTLHYIIQHGVTQAVTHASLNYMILMGALYIFGAVIYATRIPERFLPGKCDLWFQSHQLFHMLVVAAAFIHYLGITEMAQQRFLIGQECSATQHS